MRYHPGDPTLLTDPTDPPIQDSVLKQNLLQNVTYLAYPVLHELWMGLKNKQEIRALTQWRERFVQLKRLVVPTVATLIMIGEACLQLKVSGKLDPVYPKHYNDICIAGFVR